MASRNSDVNQGREPSALRLSLFFAALMGAFSLATVGVLEVILARPGVPLTPIAFIPLSWLSLLMTLSLDPPCRV